MPISDSSSFAWSSSLFSDERSSRRPARGCSLAYQMDRVSTSSSPGDDQAVTSVEMGCGSSHRKSGTRFGDRACARCFFHPPVGTCALPRAIGDPRLRAAGVPA